MSNAYRKGEVLYLDSIVLTVHNSWEVIYSYCLYYQGGLCVVGNIFGLDFSAAVATGKKTDTLDI